MSPESGISFTEVMEVGAWFLLHHLLMMSIAAFRSAWVGSFLFAILFSELRTARRSPDQRGPTSLV